MWLSCWIIPRRWRLFCRLINSLRRFWLRTENPRVGGSIPPLATTPNFLKRNGFPASPADYRAPPGRFFDRPSDFSILGPSRAARDASRAARRQPGELENWNPPNLRGRFEIRAQRARSYTLGGAKISETKGPTHRARSRSLLQSDRVPDFRSTQILVPEWLKRDSIVLGNPGRFRRPALREW